MALTGVEEGKHIEKNVIGVNELSKTQSGL